MTDTYMEYDLSLLSRKQYSEKCSVKYHSVECLILPCHVTLSELMNLRECFFNLVTAISSNCSKLLCAFCIAEFQTWPSHYNVESCLIECNADWSYEVQCDWNLYAYLATGKLLRGFDPVYPKTLWIDTKTFCNGLPFHMVFDKEVGQQYSKDI